MDADYGLTSSVWKAMRTAVTQALGDGSKLSIVCSSHADNLELLNVSGVGTSKSLVRRRVPDSAISPPILIDTPELFIAN